MDFEFEDIDEHVKNFIDLRKKLDVDLKRNVKSSQARQKKQYDARYQQGSYEIGQKVLLQNMRKLSKKGDKLKPNYYGPYEVAECLGSNNYRIQKIKGDKAILKLVCSSTRLKDFSERDNV